MQDVTVTLDNNWDNKHVVSSCYFLKMCCYRSRPVSIVAFKTLTFHMVVSQHTWGVVGSLVIVSLLIFSWFWQWQNFENRLMFDEVKAYKTLCQFLGHPVYSYRKPVDKTQMRLRRIKNGANFIANFLGHSVWYVRDMVPEILVLPVSAAISGCQSLLESLRDTFFELA